MRCFLTAIICAVCACAPAHAQTAEWSRLTDLPEAISNNAATSIVHDDGSTTIYTFMGITNPKTPSSITSASFRLTVPGDSEWTPIAPPPTYQGRARIAASAVTVGEHIYLLGGYTVADDGAETTDPRLLRYDPNRDAWSERSRPPIEVDDTVALVYEERFIILVSGWHGPDHDNTRAVQVYDTGADTWRELNPMPGPGTGLFGHAGGIAGDLIVIADGVTTPGGYAISSDVYKGIISTDLRGAPTWIDWRKSSPHEGKPTYRAAFASVDAGDGSILIVGGTDNPYNISGTGYDGAPSRPTEQVLRYSIHDGAWSTIDSSGRLTATMDHRALVPVGAEGAQWAIVGGMTAPGMATKRVQLFEIEGN